MSKITFLGVEGSGKTVLTQALVNVFKAHESEGWFLRPETRDSFRFLEQASALASQQQFFAQTTALRNLTWQAEYNHEPVQTFEMLDYPGEIYRLAFLDAKDDADPDSFEQRVADNQEEIDVFLEHLVDSEHIFVLFNPADATDLAEESRNLDAVWGTKACLEYLHKLPNHPKVSLILTQIDRYYTNEGQAFDARETYKRLLPLIAYDFPNINVFGVSAIGTVEMMHGMDHLLMECLQDVPLVQKSCKKVEFWTSKISSWRGAIGYECVQAPPPCDLIIKCRQSLQKLPWCIRNESRTQLYTEAELADLSLLLDFVYNNEAQKSATLDVQQQIAWFRQFKSSLIGKLQLMTPCATEIQGHMFNALDSLISKAKRRFAQEEKARAEQEIKWREEERRRAQAAEEQARMEREARQREERRRAQRAETIRQAKALFWHIVDFIKSQLAKVIRQAKALFWHIVDFIKSQLAKVIRQVEECRKNILLYDANHGDVQAQNKLAYTYYNSNSKDKAVYWYRKAAEQGLADAQYNLGWCYENGEGITKDPVEAVHWYRKATEQGLADAQNNLGLCYANGEGITKDSCEAVKWFSKAGVKGFASAQYNLANCYENGDGIIKNLSEAKSWYRKAAAQGHNEAKDALHRLGNSY